MRKDIQTFLEGHRQKKPVSFHMPGHKGMEIFEENGYGSRLKHLADWDITEIRGADNLFQPESIIAATMEKYRVLYGAKKTYLLINGSSAGIIASLLYAAGQKENSSIIVARNSHKSVYNALRLSGTRPVYVYPKMVQEYGVQGEITAGDVAEAMDKNPDACAVILPSPNYYGICSDISSIADAAHSRGKMLIVDQAHGAHLKFFSGRAQAGQELSFPPAAEDQGADMVINSTHKTLASFTQTAVLNVCSDSIDLADLEDRLQMIQSTSPSYPLMATLDMNADLLRDKGEALIGRWAENIKWFYEEASGIKGLGLMNVRGMDPTKINIDMSECGFNGDELEDWLMDRNIFPELVSGNIVMCMSGIGNKREDYIRLIDVLKEAASSSAKKTDMLSGPADTTHTTAEKPALDYSFTILEQVPVPARRKKAKLSEAAGKVCAGLLIPYPPGIPIACPGEILTQEVIERIEEARAAGRKVIGVSPEMEVLVGTY